MLSEGVEANGASWLLKHHLESNGCLCFIDVALLYQALQELNDWESRLHILQCLPFLRVS
tara:strand:- start:130 stop:309 length:180 start_codon:yes stop_codon:yes gene_type:complete